MGPLRVPGVVSTYELCDEAALTGAGCPRMKGDLRCCPVCGGSEFQQLYRFSHSMIIRCTTCGHGVTAWEAVGAASQALHEDERYIETRSISRAVSVSAAKDRYATLEPFHPGRDLLEIGCSTGEFLEIANAHGHRVVGIDPSAAAVRYLNSRLPNLDVRRAFVDDASLPSSGFDVIVAFHVLEHVQDPVGFLHQAMSRLRPHGLIYVRVPNLDSFQRKALGANWGNFEPALGHESHFSVESLPLALERAGFTCLGVGTGDSIEYSIWPSVPFHMYRHTAAYRIVGNILRPTSPRPDGGSRQGLAGNTLRVAAKRAMWRAYLGYLWVGSRLVWPLIERDLREGGGREIFAIARKEQ